MKINVSDINLYSVSCPKRVNMGRISKQLLITLSINQKRKRDPSKMTKISNKIAHKVTIDGVTNTKFLFNLLVLFFIIKVNIHFLYYG